MPVVFQMIPPKTVNSDEKRQRGQHVAERIVEPFFVPAELEMGKFMHQRK